jgi:hypothetical protein
MTKVSFKKISGAKEGEEKGEAEKQIEKERSRT